MSQIRAQAMSRSDIRQIANKFREGLGLQEVVYFPVVEVFEILPILYEGLSTEIVNDHELKDRYAETDIENKVIRVRQSIYDNAVEGDGFSRMTLMHEVGHYECLVNQPLRFNREPDHVKLKPYEDPEWQAKCFAGEVMMPDNKVCRMGFGETIKKCGVSSAAASYYHTYVKKKDRA